MRPRSGLSSSLLLLIVLAWSQLIAGYSTITKQSCSTSSGTRSVRPVPSTTFSTQRTTTTSVTTTSTPTTTVTPKAVTTFTTTILYINTSTVSGTSTTTVVSTKTVTVATSTSTWLTTVWVTSTKTATKVQTSTSTTTVQPSPDFQYANPRLRKRDSEPTAALLARRSSAKFGSKELFHREPNALPVINADDVAIARRQAPSFPQRVVCTKTTIVQTASTKTITAARKTVTAPASTVSTAKTTTSTTTVTNQPRTTSTVTESATALAFTVVERTSTRTTTATATSIVRATATVYAACTGSYNFLQISSDHVYANSPDVVYDSVVVADGDTYACCAACFASPNCHIGVLRDAGYCVMMKRTGFHCETRNDKVGSYDFVKAPAPLYTVFNSNCGVWDDLAT